MTWFRIDDGFHEHRKVRMLGRDKIAAVGLWTMCGTWSAATLSDGFVPREIVRRFDSRERLARKLCDVGLWVEVESDADPGYRFHQWEEHQPSRSEVLKRREDTRKRVEEFRSRKRAKQSSNGSGNALQEPLVTQSVTPPPTRPVPSRPNDSLRESSPTAVDHVTTDRVSARDRAAALSGKGYSSAAAKLVNAYAATCRRMPPAAVRNELGLQVQDLLAENWPPDEISRALEAWGAKGLDARKLPSVANEVANAAPDRGRLPPALTQKPSTTDQRVAAVQALKARLATNGANVLQLPSGDHR